MKLISQVVFVALMLAAAPEGDCTRSGDCKKDEYCRSGTCVPKGAK